MQELTNTDKTQLAYSTCYALPLVHGSLFSGIGGFDLAAEWAGWQNAFHCEWNEFGQKILKYYWPNTTSYGDITKTEFTIWRNRIDVLTGGFPCQPYSVAGKRKGKEDERHLWPQMLRAIREISPTYIVGENVAGLLSWNDGLVFNEVQTDLKNEGYEIQPLLLPACAVNAPHRRDRFWFVAYSACNRHNRNSRTERNNLDREQSTNKEQTGDGRTGETFGFSFKQFTADTESKQSERFEFGKQREVSEQEQEQFRGSNSKNIITNSGLLGQEERKQQTTRIVERSCWESFPTQPPICSGNDGISSRLDGITFPKWRAESVKAFGNAIVPQVAYQIFKAINAHERSFGCA